jgi:Proto-chlorophyllide reductase 57 kD subunit
MSNNISWTAEAEAKLKEIPFFVRPAARKKIEIFAQEKGSSEIDLQVYELAKAAFKR